MKKEIILLIVIAAAVYFLFFKKKKEEKVKLTAKEATTESEVFENFHKDFKPVLNEEIKKAEVIQDSHKPIELPTIVHDNAGIFSVNPKQTPINENVVNISN